VKRALRIVAWIAGGAVFLCLFAAGLSALSNRELPSGPWHADPARIPLDNRRDNDLETVGWRVLRFNTPHIREQMAEYCLPTIVENVNRLEGVEVGGWMPRRIDLDPPDGLQRLGLFDDLRRE
jgi:hypothetical protein